VSARSALEVVPVRGRRQLRSFIHLPYQIYRGDPNWVAPLLHDMRVMFNPARHPFYLHSEVQPLLALRGGRPVGRIAAIHNRNHIAFHQEPLGFFGFFECEQRTETAEALFAAAADWLRERGLEAMRGPTSFSTNEQAGLLIEGFDLPPAIMMPYNPAYYPRLVEECGFERTKTLVAYRHADQRPPDYLLRAEKALSRRYRVNLRKIRLDRFADELRRIRKVYNASWEENWGFVPMTDAELAFMAKELKPVVRRDPELVMMVDDEAAETVGFSLSLRDYNLALRHANGRLFPFGLIKILWHSRHLHRMRVITLGLMPEYRGKGIDALLYLRIFRKGTAGGVTEAEFSWILEDNEAMCRPMDRIGAKVYKRYRLYDRPL